MLQTEANARDSYKLYKKESSNPQDVKTYLSVGEAYREFLLSKVLEGEEVVLPARLGTLKVVGSKRKLSFTKEGVPKLAPDWVKTKALWERNPEAKLTKKRIFHTNEETSGVIYRLQWSTNRYAIENKTVYSFRLTRTHKRAIHTAIKVHKKESIISILLRKQVFTLLHKILILVSTIRHFSFVSKLLNVF